MYGWYAQDVFELPDRFLEGVIMWDTYSHTAEVEGTARIGDNEYVVKKETSTRAYGDCNWGEHLQINMHGDGTTSTFHPRTSLKT